MSSLAQAEQADPSEVIAAVDLGSNSFHMVVARLHLGQVAIVDRLREMVRLASGLSDFGHLDGPSQDRALACLRRFGQRLRDMHARQVRVVGTNTLRKAGNAGSFLAAAEDALGHPVEVISGIEEARLIYLGVSHHIDGSTGTNLVVDIGGGSTEMIIGQGYEPKRLESLSVGCVGLSERYFDGGRITGKRFRNARLAVSLEFRPILSSFRRTGWDRAVGSSGTIKTAGAVIAELGLDAEGITLPALERLIDRMISARRVDALRLPEVNCDRAPVFPGGVAILAEALANLGIDRLAVSDGALREGLLYDMIGRLRHEDARERSIRAMQARFHVDEEQASRVGTTAAQLLSSVVGEWSLDDESCSRLLHWAARLHEVGLDIAHAKYHQHGAYLVANADLPGFASFEQQRLAILIGHHRRKLDELRLESISEDWRERLFHLIVVLRLAVLLNRARSPIELPTYELIGQKRRLVLRLPKTWFTANPLTHADLLQEKAFLETRGFELLFESKRKPKA